MQYFQKIPFRDYGARLEAFLKNWGWAGVLVFAVIYYSRYYRSGLNLGGEGGTVAVVALRLMEGQRPIVDTFLGYNVMWFYPVAWLFEITGPNYIALRLFFFALCTMTGLLAFFIVRRVTGSGWFATLAALGPVVIPGMMFRNYMAFLPMLNMLTFLQAYVYEQRTAWRRWLWMAAAGASLALTYLVRIDVGAFFTAILLGLAVLYPFGQRGAFARRLGQAAGGLALAVAVFFAAHAPFYFDAVRRGYAEAFAAQYTGWISLMQYLASQQVPASPAPAAAPQKAPPLPAQPLSPVAATAPVVSKPAEAAPAKPERDIDSEDYLQKRSVFDAFRKGSFTDRVFSIALYLPIAVGGLIVLPGAALLLAALVRRDFALRTDMLAALICAGSALTLFPQYFFFRPDTPHLSEFMAPFMVAIACACWLAVKWARRRPLAWVAAGLLLAAGVSDASLYFLHAYPKESAGTIAARWKRKHELVAENGVRVFLKRQDFEDLKALCEIVGKHTRPGDYLVTYPYSPTLNFMTARPSFEYNLYVDNAHNVSHFFSETMGEFAKYRPAVIAIDNRAVNQTEESRFRNWAAETYGWIREHYSYAGTFRRQELYLRPDLYPAGEKTSPSPN